MSPKFSDRELLALAGIGRRAPSKADRPRQAEAVAAFAAEESQPSCTLIRAKRWSRGEAARQRVMARRMGTDAA